MTEGSVSPVSKINFDIVNYYIDEEKSSVGTLYFGHFMLSSRYLVTKSSL